MNPIYNVIAVGARSFGKTSLVGAIKDVPGFSPVVGRQRVEDFRRDSIVGESSPTQKKDGITVWKFESRRDKYFRLNIFDCAGEFFKDEEEDGVGHNSDEVQKSSGKWLSFDFWQNRFRLRKLDRTIRQIDAMLVLLPANWEGIDRQDLDAYVAKVCRWIRERRDRFPVWFVVNKCDVLDGEILAKIKEEADIRNLIEGSKLQKTYRAIRDAISVDGEREVHFGIISVRLRTQEGWTKLEKNQLARLDDLSEDEAAPFNVRALLMDIADVADRERGNNFVKAWDVAPWWKRMFLHPFMCLSIVGKGSSDKDLYKKMRSIRWGAWLRFCSFAFGLVMVAAASILAAASFVEWREESKFETELAENKKALPEVTRDRLIQYDDYLASNIWIRPIFFQFRLIKLRADLVDLKTNYVNWLEKDLRDELRDARKVRVDYWEVAPSNNIERAKARTEAIKGHLARLPRDFRSACIESNQVEEAKYISDFTNDIEFIEALYALRSVERRDKCRAMVRIKKEHNAQSRIRESDFNRLDSEICKLEQVLSSELSNCIARIERDNSGETWEDKSNRYAKIRDFVMSNLTCFVEEGDVFKRWKKYAEECGSTILLEQKYGPFEDDFRTNVMASTERLRVKPLEKFLRGHTPEMYPLYTNRLNEIAKDMKRINDMLFDELTNKLEDIRADAAAKSWQYQEKAATNRIALIEKYMNLVDEFTCEKLRLRKEKENAFKINVGRTGKFDEEYEALMVTSDRRFLHQAKKFRDDFNQKDFQDRADYYANIIICETNLIARIAATNNCQITAWPEPAATNFEARLERSRKIQECCEDALECFPAGHDGAALYSNQVQKAKVEATRCTLWIEMRKSMEAIKKDEKSEPKIRLLNIGSFFEKYPKDDNVEPELVWIYEEIGDIQSNAESKFIQTIKGKLSELTISGTEKSNRKQEVLKKRIAVLTDACRYLIKDSDSARAYGKMLKSEIDCLSDEEKSGEFLKDYEQFVKTIARKDPASKIKEIDSFLRGHPEEIYMSLGFPHVYEKLKKDKRRFEDERDWGNAKYDVEEFLKSSIKSKIGDDGFRGEMKGRRDDAERYKTNISKFKNSDFGHEVHSLIEELTKVIAEIDRLIGAGGWQDIVDAEKEWKKNPSEENYTDLMNKFDDFKKEGNKQDILDSYEVAKANFDAYCDCKKRVMDTRQEFKERPGRGSYSALKIAAASMREWLNKNKDYNVANTTLNKIIVWVDWVSAAEQTARPIEIRMKWVGCDFRNTPFHAKAGDHELKLELNGELMSAIHGFKDDKWDSLSTKYKLWKVLLHGFTTKTYPLEFTGKGIGVDGRLAFRLTDYGRQPDEVAGDDVGFWDLMSKGEGEFDYQLNLKMQTGDVNSKGPTITLRFYDIYVCP